jgi:hypothetical protein
MLARATGLHEPRRNTDSAQQIIVGKGLPANPSRLGGPCMYSREWEPPQHVREAVANVATGSLNDEVSVNEVQSEIYQPLRGKRIRCNYGGEKTAKF